MKENAEKKWEMLEKETLYSGYFDYLKISSRYQRYDNKWSKKIEREIFERGDAVSILLYDPKEDSVVMVEQFRSGAIRHPKGPWTLEIVAGTLEDDESPEECIVREVQEEAGITLNNPLLKISDYLLSPGGSTERMWLFFSETNSADAEGSFGLEDSGENTKVVVLKRKDAMKMIEDGEIFVASAILSLYWLENKLKNE